jgi:hypothetical protein
MIGPSADPTIIATGREFRGFFATAGPLGAVGREVLVLAADLGHSIAAAAENFSVSSIVVEKLTDAAGQSAQLCSPMVVSSPVGIPGHLATNMSSSVTLSDVASKVSSTFLPRSPIAGRSGGSPQLGLLTLWCIQKTPSMEDVVAFEGILVGVYGVAQEALKPAFLAELVWICENESLPILVGEISIL